MIEVAHMVREDVISIVITQRTGIHFKQLQICLLMTQRTGIFFQQLQIYPYAVFAFHD